MKIAFVVVEFPALSETFILNQITGLIDRGHEVDIYANVARKEPKIHSDVKKYNLLNRTYYWPQRPKNKIFCALKGLELLFTNFFKEPGILLRSLNVFKYGKRAGSLLLLYPTIMLLRQQQSSYDIIQCHFGFSGLSSVFLRDIGVLRGKLITTFHGFDLTGNLQTAGDRIYEPLFEMGDLFMPISIHWKRRLIELGCDEKKITVHRMGIDCQKFAFTPRQLNADGRIRLLTIARLVEKKGVEYSIRAVAELAKINRNIEYNIVGDGILREHLEQLVQELDVVDIVNLLGWKHEQEVIKILNTSNILLAPSVTSQAGDQEGIPVVLMEAMAMGLPVITTQHSGIPELVENGVSGFLVPERDVDALVEKLTYLVKHPEVWAMMGQAGRACVEEYFNIDKLNNKLVEIYRELVI